jgi:hypothetical protein
MKSAALGLTCALLLPQSAGAAGIDWTQVDQTLGRKAMQTENVHRYGFPRNDLKVRVDEVEMKPTLALGGWIAFEEKGDSAMMMGDLVLVEPEINPVMNKLLAGGVEVTGVHNHLLRAQPPTFYLHVYGHGDPVKLATTVHDALSATATPSPAASEAASAALDLPTAEIETALGAKGKANGGVLQFSIPRHDEIKSSGMAIKGAMGTANALGFQTTQSGQAAVTGDFVALANEVNPLLKALRANGIEVTAVHNHMLDDEPHAFFVHFWANGDPLKLARGLKAGLDAVHAGRV